VTKTTAELPPADLRVRADPDVLVRDGGRLLVGGVPPRLVRLTESGAEVMARWSRGDVVGAEEGRRRLARLLLDAGMLLTDPRASGHLPLVPVQAVVPTHGRTRQLDRCLASIVATAPATPVLVVDDGSPDPEAVRRVADRHGAAVVRHAERRGPAAARNTGLRHTRGELIAFVDSDVVVEPSTLARLAAHFADPRLGAAAPRVLAPQAPTGVLAAYEDRHSSLDMGASPGGVGPGSRVPYVPSTTLVLRRRAIPGDGFDERLSVGEDVDLVWRMRQRAWRISYDPSVAVRHDHRTAPAAFVGRRYAYATSIGTLATRHARDVRALRTDAVALGALALAGLGRPGAAAGLLFVGTIRLRATLRTRTEHPTRLALELAARKHVGLGRAVAHAIRRPWAPLVVAGAGLAPRRAALALAIAQVVHLAEKRPPARDVPLLIADDLISAAGTWVSCWQQRTLRPLLPSRA